MRNWGLGDQLLDLLDGLFEPLMAFANEISQSAFALGQPKKSPSISQARS